MAVSTPEMIDDMYSGGMSEKQASLIQEIKKSKSVPNLKEMVFDFSPELIARSIEESKSIRQIVMEEKISVHDKMGELRDYQTLGVAFMYFSPRSILGDGVGLGKTVEVAALINFLKLRGECKRFLMAVETTALVQTQLELMRFTGLNVITLPSEKSKLTRAIKKIDFRNVDGIVIKHSALKSDTFSSWLAHNINSDGTCRIFDVFILDESSVIKNIDTKTYSYTSNICNLAKRVHFMNATTFETKLMDIYTQMDMINTYLLPPVSKINSRYCTYGRTSYWKKVGGKPKKCFNFTLTGYKNQAEFKSRLGLCYFGRTKKDIGLDLPHTYKVYTVEPTTKQMLAIEKGYRYGEVLNCPSLIEDIDIGTTVADVPKINRLVSLIENEFSDDKVMVYVFHREAQVAIKAELEKIGRKVEILCGDTTDQMERYRIQNDFNTGDCDVILTNVKKSLNLYGGDVCIFYSVLTNPASMFQVAGRIDRNVDDRIKTFILLLYEHTREYETFRDIVAKRSKDSKELILDAKTAVDYFIEAME